MIAITLNFKSIEAARAALLEIPASSLVGVEEAPAPKSKKASAPVAEPPAAPPPPTAAPVEAPAPAAAPATPEPAPEPAPAEVTYADLQKAVLALYSKDRGAAQAIATGMGFASYKVMPPERWAEALANVNAALEA